MKFLFISSFFLFIFVLSPSIDSVACMINWDESEALLNFDGRKSINESTESLKNEHENNLKKWHLQCFQETGVDPDLVITLKSGNWQVKDKLLKDWVLCLLNKYDLMSMEGVFRLDTAMALTARADRAMMEDLIDECLPKKDMEPRDIAWRYAKCYHLHAQANKKKRLHYLTLFY